MSLIALKFVAAGMIAVGLLCVTVAVAAAVNFITGPVTIIGPPDRKPKKPPYVASRDK